LSLKKRARRKRKRGEKTTKMERKVKRTKRKTKLQRSIAMKNEATQVYECHGGQNKH
jgi:hypothetical protein